MPNTDEITYGKIGAALKAILARRKMRKNAAAAAAGMSAPQLCDILQGRTRPTLGTLQRLADGLGLTLRIELHPGEEPTVIEPGRKLITKITKTTKNTKSTRGIRGMNSKRPNLVILDDPEEATKGTKSTKVF